MDIAGLERLLMHIESGAIQFVARDLTTPSLFWLTHRWKSAAPRPLGVGRYKVRLDDNEISISGARRADVTGLGARAALYRGIGIAKIRRNRQSLPQQGRHPVDVGRMDKDALAARLRMAESRPNHSAT